MRRLLTLALLAVLAWPAAAAARERGANDGTLSIKDGRGMVSVQGRGGAIGTIAKGSVTITDPIDGDGTGPIVSGADSHRAISDTTDLYRGTSVRFRMIGGSFRVVIKGRGINLSFVGIGRVTLKGAGTEDDGTFSVNGGDYGAVPDFLAFPVSATSP